MDNCIPSYHEHRRERKRQLREQQIYAAMQSRLQPVAPAPVAPAPVAPPPVAPKPSYDELVVAEANRRIDRKLFQEDVAKRMIIIENDRQRVEREERFAKWEEKNLAGRAKREAEKMIKKQKQQEERERIRQQQEAEYVVVRLERQQFENDANIYIAELMTNFQTGFKYEDLEKDEKAKELVKLYKFHNRFMDVAKQEYRKNGHSVLLDYLTKYYAVVRTMPEFGYDLHHAWGQARNTICT
jgi:hypothetical protein